MVNSGMIGQDTTAQGWITNTDTYALRFRRVQIACCDAGRIIKNWDVPDAFFSLDPPYGGADQGHYDGIPKKTSMRC
jgi:site-specific DNA-adenine methylase